MIGRLVPSLLLLAAFVTVTVLLLAEARHVRRHRARELEHAIRPPITLDDPLDLDTWCCELAVLTRGRDHEKDQPCAAEAQR